MFISNAYAQATAIPGGMGEFGQLLPLIAMFVLLYFIIIRPQTKRAKEVKTMLDGLQKGDEVVAAGILGKITKISDNVVSLEIADNTIISVQKQAISQLLPKGTLKAAH
ncbi:MAG: preprotein translocase subunit YajC [Pseudomonadota bacterium]